MFSFLERRVFDMKSMSTQLFEAIRQVQGKGDPILLSGATGSGKSALLTECAKTDIVKRLLSMRESEGKGSLIPTTVCVTDHKDIPDDCLIMTADVCYQTAADCGDDNSFLGNLLYTAAKEYERSAEEEKYRAKLSNAMAYALEHPANDSLAYKLKDMDGGQREKLLEIISKFAVDDVMAVYHEMQAKDTKKGKEGLKTFIELLSNREKLKPLIAGFWDATVDYINCEAEELRHELSEAGAYVNEISKGSYHFVAVLGEDDVAALDPQNGNAIACTLLKSEDGSKEHLLSHVTLIYCGADRIFEVPHKDTLTVTEAKGNQIHCVKLIDTQGLFHSTGAQITSESERIIDLLSQYHSNRVLLATNSEIYNTTKDGHEAVTTTLQAMNRDIEIYILFTHWDTYLKGTANQTGTGSRFGPRNSIDWEAMLPLALELQSKIVEQYTNALALNTSKKKPRIVGVYRSALLLDPENKMEDVLARHKISYECAVPAFISDLTAQIAAMGPKYRVTEGISEKVTLDTSASGQQNIPALYNNLVACKGLKLYASTVRACIRKWCDSGNIHKSVVFANSNGFQNINTYFVQEIRNYAMLYVKKMLFQFEGFLSNREEAAAFQEDLLKDLTAQQNLGRQAARILGQEAYKEGFEQCKGFRYQYQRFEDMLQYLQDTYFTAPSIPLTPKFEECLIQAAQECISNFIDAKCIVVY